MNILTESNLHIIKIVQTGGARETSYSDLNALIGEYMTQKMKNGLVYALKFPLSPERDDDMDSGK